MGDETDGWNRRFDISGQGGCDIAVLIQFHLFQTQIAQFLLEQARQIKLFERAGDRFQSYKRIVCQFLRNVKSVQVRRSWFLLRLWIHFIIALPFAHGNGQENR